jgi:hypothetical protein
VEQRSTSVERRAFFVQREELSAQPRAPSVERRDPSGVPPSPATTKYNSCPCRDEPERADLCAGSLNKPPPARAGAARRDGSERLALART